jgi:hypothetical protein
MLAEGRKVGGVSRVKDSDNLLPWKYQVEVSLPSRYSPGRFQDVQNTKRVANKAAI